MMKQFLSLLFVFFLFSDCFSQTTKPINGKVLSGGMALSGIDIVNMNSKKITKSDSNGSFSILGKTGDELFIISKEYLDQKIVLTQAQFDLNNLIITLEKKPIELDNVTIQRVESMKIKVSQADLDEVKLEKQKNALKVQNVYTGEIENGVDFVRIGKGIANLFKNKDEEKTETPVNPINFKDYITTNFDNVFFIEQLKLNPEEINLFISYCEIDSKSKTILENQNLLETIEFMLSKNEDFKKPIDTNK
jgi:hypothetical protein